MYQLSEEQITFILSDIKAKGIVIEDLQNNLLDHICCIIENELKNEEDFFKFYERTLPRFFKFKLNEIEQETNNLLTFKNYYVMKNTVKYSGITSALLILLGAIFKTMHWPGAGFLILLGGLSFSLIFLPLLILLKFKDEEKTVDNWVFAFGFLMAIGAATGIVFKIMHWPYANLLMRGSVTLFLFVYIPIYYFTQIKRSDSKFNTTINTILMMAWGGMTYALFNLHPNTNIQVNPLATYAFVDYNTRNLLEANAIIYNKLNNQKKPELLKQKTTKLYHKIADIKSYLIANADQIPMEKAKSLPLEEVKNGEDYKIIKNIFENSINEYSLSSLTIEINAYNEMVNQLFPNQKEKLIGLENLQLNNTNLSVLLQQLSQIQLHLAYSENALLLSIK
jgi:hypothetical protein